MSQRGIKSIIADLVGGDKLNGDNYSMWRRKISYVLEEQEVTDVLTTFLPEPEANASRRDQDGYAAWKRRDTIARITMLSAMTDDVLVQFETHPSASAMWAALKSEFDGTSAARLRRLTVKLDNFKLGPNTPIRHHLRAMQNLIRELKEAGGALSDEQQIQAVMRSLPASWDTMKHTITHNESIKTFADVARHLQLEDDRMETVKPVSKAYLTEGKGGTTSQNQSKRSKGSQNKKGGPKVKKGKSPFKKGKKPAKKRNIATIKCYACQQKGHYAKDCPEQKKTQGPQTT